jgi:hypothetical protein
MSLFDTRERLNEIRSLLRQLADLTSPNLPPLEGEFRSENRSNRALPALLAPWEEGGPVVDECTYALTKDLSDRGVALVLHQPFKAPQVVVGLWLEFPRFALGDVRQNVPLGGGFWQLGVEIVDVLEPGHYPEVESLVPLAAHLLPRGRSSAR